MRVTVIGAAGSMGEWLVKYLVSTGHQIVMSDLNRPRLSEIQRQYGGVIAENNRVAASKADAVIVSVPIDRTTEVVREIATVLSTGAILCEISSLKCSVIDLLRRVSQSHIQPLSLHPLFGPGARLHGGRMAIIPINDLERELESARTLFPTHSFIRVESEEHDRIMTLTILVPYLLNLVYSALLADESLKKINDIGGTTFRLQTIIAGAILAQSPSLHRQLFMNNQYVSEIVDRTKTLLSEISDMLHAERDERCFFDFFKATKREFETVFDTAEMYKIFYNLLERVIDGSKVQM